MIRCCRFVAPGSLMMRLTSQPTEDLFVAADPRIAGRPVIAAVDFTSDADTFRA